MAGAADEEGREARPRDRAAGNTSPARSAISCPAYSSMPIPPPEARGLTSQLPSRGSPRGSSAHLGRRDPGRARAPRRPRPDRGPAAGRRPRLPRGDAAGRSARPARGDSPDRRCRTTARAEAIRDVGETIGAPARHRPARPDRPRPGRDRRSGRRSKDAARNAARRTPRRGAGAEDQHIGCQLSVVSCRLSVVSCRLSGCRSASPEPAPFDGLVIPPFRRDVRVSETTDPTTDNCDKKSPGRHDHPPRPDHRRRSPRLRPGRKRAGGSGRLTPRPSRSSRR